MSFPFEITRKRTRKRSIIFDNRKVVGDFGLRRSRVEGEQEQDCKK